nr:virion core protein D3 [Wadden Sea poxvirus]
MEPNIDIYVVNDIDIYYINNNNNNIELFICLGNHNNFIKHKISYLHDNKSFFVKYYVTPDNYGSLCITTFKSNFKLNDKYITVEDFINFNYQQSWCKYFNENLEQEQFNNDKDKIIIYDILYNHLSKWKRYVFIICPYMIDSKYETYLTNPMLLLNNDTQYIYQNVMLRASINSLIYDKKKSKLLCMLNNVITSYKIDNITILVHDNNIDDLRLTRLCYDRDRFKAFVFAWFQSQITNSEKENEKVKKIFESIYKLI